MPSTSMRLVRKPHAAVVADEVVADEVVVDAGQEALVVEIGIEAVIDG